MTAVAAVNSTARAPYGASPKQRRNRNTAAQNTALDEAIVQAVAAEHPVSLRGVFYRVVSAGAVEKSETEYKRVGYRLVKLRANGAVPYGWITDGTRLMRKPESWDNVEEMLQDAALSYRRALWRDQDAEVIILSEKDAISGAVLPVTARWDVELGITRGYSSVTFSHSVAESVEHNTILGKTTWIYQLGDHDPSGVDGWRALQDAVRDFAPLGDVRFERLAVTPAQITEYNLPTRPTKKSDSRAKSFVGESVEVDAIAPTVLREIVENAIVQHIDAEALRITRIAERDERNILTRMSGGAE